MRFAGPAARSKETNSLDLLSFIRRLSKSTLVNALVIANYHLFGEMTYLFPSFCKEDNKYFHVWYRGYNNKEIKSWFINNREEQSVI